MSVLDFEVPSTPKSEAPIPIYPFASNEAVHDQGVQGEWPDPVFFVQNETPEVSTDVLPGWMAEYAGAVSRNTKTPQAMAVMISLSVLATCNQKRFEVSPYGDDYTEPLSLWTVSILPSGNRKTAVLNALTNPLNEWERTQGERMEKEIQEAETKRAVVSKTIDRKQVDASKADDPAERDSLIEEINRLKESLPDEIRAPRLWSGDVTPERLQNLMTEHGERMSILADEGGIFEVMSGLYNDGRVNIDIFLQGHAGRPVRVDRGSRFVSMASPALTFGLAVQPDIVRDLASGTKKRFRGNGTLARFLYALPRCNIGHRDHTERHPIPETLKSSYTREISRLLNYQTSSDGLGNEGPSIIRLSEGALTKWTAFQQYIESRQGEGGDLEFIQDWTAKLPGAALRIAGNIHIAENSPEDLSIGQEIMVRVLDFCELLIQHAQAAFGLMAADPAIEDAKRVLAWIEDNREPSFKRSECHAALRGRFNRVEQLKRALEVLEERHFISGPNKGETKKPTIFHTVNPKILREGR